MQTQKPEKNFKDILKLVSFAIILFAVGFYYYNKRSQEALLSSKPTKAFSVEQRPEAVRLIFDYAELLKEHGESLQGYLTRIKDGYDIEALILSLDRIESDDHLTQFAAKIFGAWQIGVNYGGRGLLLILIKDQAQVKLEVAYELEDVFTDAFSGYVEDKQLRPYFLSGQSGLGLIALMEELEKRAQIKYKNNYTTKIISSLDQELLSGGAGAARNLAKYKADKKVNNTDKDFPPADSPELAWKQILKMWGNWQGNENKGLYSEAAKLAFRDYRTTLVSLAKRDYDTYAKRPYSILQKGNYAVVSFGIKDGWDNSPYLLFRDSGGWKLDLASKRKLVTMGPSPAWGVQRCNNPYAELLDKFPAWMDKDLPLAEEDTYTAKKDKDLGRQIRKLEKEFKQNSNNFDIALELGRLNIMIAARPDHVFSALNKAKQINPKDPAPYKYLAIYHQLSNFQTKSAIKELKEFQKLAPQDPFGANYMGFLYLQQKQYKKAMKEFEKAIKLNAASIYTYSKLARAYAHLYLNEGNLNPFKQKHKEKALAMYQEVKNLKTTDAIRYKWLERWLTSNNILSN